MPEIKIIPSHRAVIVDSGDMKQIKETIDKCREWIKEHNYRISSDIKITPEQHPNNLLDKIDEELSKIELPED